MIEPEQNFKFDKPLYVSQKLLVGVTNLQFYDTVYLIKETIKMRIIYQFNKYNNL